jgi:hypothetical protein
MSPPSDGGAPGGTGTDPAAALDAADADAKASPTAGSTVGAAQGCKGASSKLEPHELKGKSAQEIRQLAINKGFVQDPKKPNKYRDPNTGIERLRIDPGHVDATTGKPYNNPNAAVPHVHGYDKDGKKIRDTDTNDPHFPLK